MEEIPTRSQRKIIPSTWGIAADRRETISQGTSQNFEMVELKNGKCILEVQDREDHQTVNFIVRMSLSILHYQTELHYSTSFLMRAQDLSDSQLFFRVHEYSAQICYLFLTCPLNLSFPQCLRHRKGSSVDTELSQVHVNMDLQLHHHISYFCCFS